MVSQTRWNYFAATIFVQADGSVLRRLNAIPDRYMFSPNYTDHVNNGSAYSELTGRDDFTLGSLRLDSLEVSIFFLWPWYRSRSVRRYNIRVSRQQQDP